MSEAAPVNRERAHPALARLQREHPEWRPWLAAVGVVQQAIVDPTWEAGVPDRLVQHHPDAPLLAHATLGIADGAMGTLLSTVVQALVVGAVAPTDGSRPQWRTALERIGAIGTVSAFGMAASEAALCNDLTQLRALAHDAMLDPDALHAVAAIVRVPLLQAVGRRHVGAIPPAWSHGYCPICGSWPSLAQECGVERERMLRCGPCGSAWRSSVLACAFCGESGHDLLGTLVADDDRDARPVVETCRRCNGYLKVQSVLRPSPPQEVVIEDLSGTHFDAAAVSRGFRRPEGVGYRLRIALRAAVVAEAS